MAPPTATPTPGPARHRPRPRPRLTRACVTGAGRRNLAVMVALGSGLGLLLPVVLWAHTRAGEVAWLGPPPPVSLAGSDLPRARRQDPHPRPLSRAGKGSPTQAWTAGSAGLYISLLPFLFLHPVQRAGHWVNLSWVALGVFE